MPVIRRPLNPGETIFGGGAGAIFLGRRPTAAVPPTTSADDDAAQPAVRDYGPRGAEEALMQMVQEQINHEQLSMGLPVALHDYGDPICMGLQRMGYPVTLSNYLNLGYRADSIDELTPEDRALIPSFLLPATE